VLRDILSIGGFDRCVAEIFVSCRLRNIVLLSNWELRNTILLVKYMRRFPTYFGRSVAPIGIRSNIRKLSNADVVFFTKAGLIFFVGFQQVSTSYLSSLGSS